MRGVAQAMVSASDDVFQRHVVFARHVEDLPDQIDDALGRNVALEIAAERRHQAAALDRDAVRLVHVDEIVLRLKLLPPACGSGCA